MINWSSKGPKRAGVAANAAPVTIAPGATGPFTFRFTIPDKPQISGVQFSVYLLPRGAQYKDRTHSAVVTCRLAPK
jgi:hypothetical protein